MEWLWMTGRNSRNDKTGPIPTSYPADTAAAWASCEGCVLRAGKRYPGKRNPEKPQCYFWYGQAEHGMLKMQEAAARGKDYSLPYALAKRRKAAKAVRMAGGGDPATTVPAEYFGFESLVHAAGLAFLSYTHFWKSKGSWLKGHAMASCDTFPEALEAVRAGWRAAVHLKPQDLPERPVGRANGISYVVCPAQREDKNTTCNQCRLCDASKTGKYPQIVIFRNH